MSAEKLKRFEGARDFLTIAFIGNPNCGKTTLFNAFTGARLKVANWPGVTVEKAEGSCHYRFNGHDCLLSLVDLPGTYSLSSYTMEEEVSRDFILSPEVDVIINVVDASALERNLYLSLQLLELGKPVVMALNMMDIVEHRGIELDLHRFPELLGIPIIPISARKRRGLDTLLHAAVHHVCDTEAVLEGQWSGLDYSEPLEAAIDELEARLRRHSQAGELAERRLRWTAVKLLEKDQQLGRQYRELAVREDLASAFVNEKYNYIEYIVREVMLHREAVDAKTDALDRVLAHGVWGRLLVPFLVPLGLGYWQLAVALIAGISAKEVVVSSCAVLFGIGSLNSAGGMAAAGERSAGAGLRRPECGGFDGILPAVRALCSDPRHH